MRLLPPEPGKKSLPVRAWPGGDIQQRKSDMCGIVAYLGPKNGVPVVLDGLRKLEYRGYDSAGIAVLNQEKIDLYFGNYKIVEKGTESPKFNEEEVYNYLKKNKEVEITINLNSGNKKWEFFTCDLSYEYVKINAEYRT